MKKKTSALSNIGIRLFLGGLGLVVIMGLATFIYVAYRLFISGYYWVALIPMICTIILTGMILIIVGDDQ